MSTHDIPIDYFSTETPLSGRFVRIHTEGFGTLVPVLPPHLLQTLIHLASFMGETRRCHTSSRQLSDELAVSRETARDRLRDLERVRINGKPLVTVLMVRPAYDKPARYGVSFSELVPVTCGDGLVVNERWVKYFEQAKVLAQALSPEAFVTLLALCIEMDEERILRVPMVELGRKLGVSESNAAARISELIDKGMIIKASDPQGNVYEITDRVAIRYGGDEDRGAWQRLPTLELTIAGGSTCSSPHIKKNKRLKEEKTTTRVGEECLPLPSCGTAVVNEAVREKQAESVAEPVFPGTPDCVPGEKSHMEEGDGKDCAELELIVGHGRGDYAGAPFTPHVDPVFTALAADPVPFVAAVGAEVANAWIGQYGVARCMEVWEKAQKATNPGGYMRKALEEGWRWVEAAKPAEPIRPYLMDHAASRARAAELAGIQLDSRTDDAKVIDLDWVNSLRQIAGAR